MKFIREYRTTLHDEYVYQLVVTGSCTDNNPSAFKLIATSEGSIPIEQTNFFELWNYANNCEMEIEITTKFEYRRMARTRKGIFVMVISGISALDATILALKFGEYINRGL
ncbi:hypothetical protein [Undibacterium sp. WLHG33]|uniref:hypothetical protein n=1 Tax=Undibacterium sp. WLHG33 TaxID=3412482 RepID=UPI003C30AAAA